MNTSDLETVTNDLQTTTELPFIDWAYVGGGDTVVDFGMVSPG